MLHEVLFSMRNGFQVLFERGYTGYKFYWRDKVNTTPIGPFTAVFEAVADYEKSLQNIETTNKNPKEATIYRVDFKAKKLIID